MKNFFKKSSSWFKKQFWALFLVVCLLFSSLLTLMMFVGSDAIVHYIEQNAQKVPNRSLTFGMDSVDGHAYVQNNNDEQKIKLLLLTDLHMSASMTTFAVDRMLVDAIINIVTATKPDLILLGGDLIYPSPDRLVLNSKNSVTAIGTLFEKFEIPWAPIFGNHDADKYATLSKSQLSAYYESLEYCLFQRGPSTISGQGNYIIKLLSQSGSLVQALFMMDSGGYLAPSVYDFVRDDQVAWYAEELASLTNENGIVPTQVFLHIPLHEYRTAWSLHEQGSPEVQYHFGVKGSERIASSLFGNFFYTMVRLGSTKAVYAGHDHKHNFSITHQGVRLTYNMSMDFNAYYGIARQTKQRGGSLIEVAADGSFEIVQIKQTNNFLPPNQ